MDVKVRILFRIDHVKGDLNAPTDCKRASTLVEATTEKTAIQTVYDYHKGYAPKEVRLFFNVVSVQAFTVDMILLTPKEEPSLKNQ